MSTETAYVATSEEIRRAELRRREAEAREARRRAEEEKARQRAEEAARRRIAQAQQAIGAEELRFQELVSRLDTASLRLPDLHLIAPALPTMEGAAPTPEAFERYAQVVVAATSHFARRLDAAIADAEAKLQRRIATAAAWQDINALEAKSEGLTSEIAMVEARLDSKSSVHPAPIRPGKTVELEALQAHQSRLDQYIESQRQHLARLQQQLQARQRAGQLAGTTVVASSATETQARHRTQQALALREQRQRLVNQQLQHHGLQLVDLGLESRNLINSAVNATAMNDAEVAAQLQALIAREQQRIAGRAKALDLLQQVPEYVQDDARLLQRWDRLASRLQNVANGADDFVPDIDREYQQIADDAKRNLKAAHGKAEWICAMSKQGFTVLDAENGELVVLDLQDPDVWLKITELGNDQGAFAVHMEIMADPDRVKDADGQKTDAICARLDGIRNAGSKVNAVTEALSKVSKISSGKRPKLKTYSAVLP